MLKKFDYVITMSCAPTSIKGGGIGSRDNSSQRRKMMDAKDFKFCESTYRKLDHYKINIFLGRTLKLQFHWGIFPLYQSFD